MARFKHVMMGFIITSLLMLSTLTSLASAQSGVFIRFMGQELVNGTSKVCLSEIGEQLSVNGTIEDREEGTALVCVTDNTDCCRGVDNNAGGARGEWTLNGDQIAGSRANPPPELYRNRGTGLVRLNHRGGSTDTGTACCVVPDSNNVTQTLCVELTLGVFIRFMGQELVNGTSRVCLSEIGEQLANNATEDREEGTALVCVTDNTDCCRGVDNNAGGARGGWTLNGDQIAGSRANPPPELYRNRGTGLVRLNHRGGSNDTGTACCDVPDSNNVTQTLCVELTLANDVCGLQTTINPTTVVPTTTLDIPSVAAPDLPIIVGTVGAIIVVAITLILIVICCLHQGKKKRTYSTYIRSDTDTKDQEATNNDIVDTPFTKSVVYAEIDVSKKTKMVNSNKDSNGTTSNDNLTHSHKVPDDKLTHINQARLVSYASVDSEIVPTVPVKSPSLEKFLETQPLKKVDRDLDYSEIGPVQTPEVNAPQSRNGSTSTKSSALQSLSNPIASLDTEPLYDLATTHATNSFHTQTPAHSTTLSSSAQSLLLINSLYKDPTSPAAKPSTKENDNVYDTIYSEAIQPSLFKTSTPSQYITQEADLVPYSSIYTIPTAPQGPKEKPLNVSADNIEEVHLLGTGNFGKVVLAKTMGLSRKQLKMSKGDTDINVPVHVAVKMLKEEASKSLKEAFEKEYKFMSLLNHPCVIRLLGICNEGTPFIMMEYMEKGDLNQYLKTFESITTDPQSGSNDVITTSTLVFMCSQIASGMEYLAQQNFVHRDLATRNCLVGHDNTVKIADFGMSRNLYESHYYIINGQAILPIRWMATECFYGKFSTKSDVWAFGVTMWEIFTLGKVEPYHELKDMELVEDAVKDKGRMILQRPKACPVDIYRVMEECFVCEPSERATFEDVFSHLSSLNFKYNCQ